MNFSFSTTRAILLSGAVAGASLMTTAARAQVVADPYALNASKNHVSNFVDLIGSVGYSSNPRLSASGAGSSGAFLGRASAFADHSIVSDRGSTDVSAYVENQSYSNGTPSTQIFRLAANASRIVSPRFNIFGGASFSGDFGGQLYNRFVSVPSAPPVTDFGNPLPTLVNIDPAFVSLNRRSYQAAANAGFAYKLSARDALNASAGYSRLFYTGTGTSLNTSTTFGSIGWDRQFSERTTGGLRGVVSYADFGNRGHSTVFTPQITAHTTLTEVWNASGSIGISLINQQTLTNHSKSADLSFEGSLCHSTPNERICGSGGRSQQSSIGEGLVTATTATVSYFRRMNARDTLQAGASIARSSGGASTLILGSSTYYTATASYNRKISPRLSTGVEGSLSKVVQRLYSVPVQASGVVFLRYRLGDMQ